MMYIPTRQKALEASIVANRYTRGCMLEIMEIMQQRTLKGEFMFLYRFSAKGNEHYNQKIVDYLKLKKLKVTDCTHNFNGWPGIKISW